MHTLDLNILGARRVYQSVDRDASSCSTTAMKTSSNEDNEHASLENSFFDVGSVTAKKELAFAE